MEARRKQTEKKQTKVMKTAKRASSGGIQQAQESARTEKQGIVEEASFGEQI